MKRNFELELEAVQALQEQQLTSRDGSVDCSIALMRDGGDLKEVRHFDQVRCRVSGRCSAFTRKRHIHLDTRKRGHTNHLFDESNSFSLLS